MQLKLTRNNRYLPIAIIGTVVLFPLFKWLYPYPDFFTDTDYYIATAVNHANYDIWPLGYSKFLEYGQLFTHNDLLLVGFQYLFIQAASFYFFVIVRRLFNPGKEIEQYIFIFLMFDPLNLYIGNYVTTDALFWALTLIWITLLLQIIQKPGWRLVILQALLLALLSPIRYTSLYYPVILVSGIGLSKNTTLIKAIGTVLPCGLVLLYWIFIRQATYQVTQTKDFNSFSGWQLANNALYMYPYIPRDSPRFQDQEINEISTSVRKYFDTTRIEQMEIGPRDGAFYIWSIHSPLGKYAINYTNKRGWRMDRDFLKAWGQLAPLYRAYANQLITDHPSAYLRYYIFPNATCYCYPPLESLAIYDGGTNHISAFVQKWFRYKSQVVYCFSNSFQSIIFSGFPLFFGAANIGFLFTVLWYISKRPLNKPSAIFPYLLFGTITLSINVLFSIFVAPIVFRYQIVPFELEAIFAALTYDQLKKGINTTPVSIPKLNTHDNDRLIH